MDDFRRPLVGNGKLSTCKCISPKDPLREEVLPRRLDGRGTVKVSLSDDPRRLPGIFLTLKELS